MTETAHNDSRALFVLDCSHNRNRCTFLVPLTALPLSEPDSLTNSLDVPILAAGAAAEIRMLCLSEMAPIEEHAESRLPNDIQ